MRDLEQAAYVVFGLVTLALGMKNVATGPTLWAVRRNGRPLSGSLLAPWEHFRF